MTNKLCDTCGRCDHTNCRLCSCEVPDINYEGVIHQVCKKCGHCLTNEQFKELVDV